MKKDIDEKKLLFSKEEYQNLKNEIKMRKEYKEKLLQKKGIPILENYVRV